MDFSKIHSPAFILEEDKLRRNLSIIADVQKRAEVQIILAFKAFSMWSVFSIVKEYISGATASSLFEARLCFEEMGTKAHTYAPAYFPNEFDQLMELSSHITFNSIAQYERFQKQLSLSSHPISAGIRVNPEYSEVETDLYNPCAPGSRLGEVIDNFKGRLPKGIEGLHFHNLCESNSYALEKTLASFEERFGDFLPQLKWINMGGGHLMTQKDYDIEHLIQVLQSFRKRHPNIKVILEPGSAFAWQTGVLYTTVMDIISNNGIQTAIIDASFTAHMPDTLEMPYRPTIRGAKDNDQGEHLYRIGGVSCLAGDFMEVYAFDQALKVGDSIIFKDMIHYTMVKTTMFNGVKHPSIAIWTKEREMRVIREFSYLDFKRRLS